MEGEVKITLTGPQAQVTSELRRMADELDGGESEADWYIGGNGASEADVHLQVAVENGPAWEGGVVAETRRED